MKNILLKTLLTFAITSGAVGQNLPFNENFSSLGDGVLLTTSNTEFDYVRTSDDGTSSTVGKVTRGKHWAALTTSAASNSNLPIQYSGFGTSSLQTSNVLDISLSVFSSYWRVNSGLIIAMGDWDSSTSLYDDNTLGSNGNFAVQLWGNSGGGSAQLQNLSADGESFSWETIENSAVQANEETSVRFVANNGSETITINSIEIGSGQIAAWVNDVYLNTFDLLGNASTSSLRILAHGRGGSNSGALEVELTDISISAIPEPGTQAALLGAAMFLLALLSHKGIIAKRSRR